MTPRLVTLAFSHYNEKARWALDHCGVAYKEHRFMPGFSQLAVFAATRGRGGRTDAVSSTLSTPVLITGDGERICDSTDIARWAQDTTGVSLFPEPAVLELVDEFGRELGPYTRRLAYWHVLKSPSAMRVMADRNVGRAQALAYRALAPVGARLLVRGLRIDAAHARTDTERVEAQLARVEARLAGRDYLVGDRFTAADLTFAALLAPLLLVTRAEGYGATLPDASQLLPETNAIVAELRARPAGRFALAVYRRNRVKSRRE